MLRAAEMAVFEIGEQRLILLPRDTGSTPTGTVNAARSVTAEGVRLILGPLFGAHVAPVRGQARAAGISVVTFSNDAQVAAPDVYVFGFSPPDQVRRVVGFAQSRGMRRFAVLAPRNAFGVAVVRAFSGQVTRQGGTVAHSAQYQPDGSDIVAVLDRLAGAFGRPGSGAAGRLGTAAIDALLIAEAGPPLEVILEQLEDRGIDRTTVQLLGTGLWDVPATGRLARLVGAWYAAPAPDRRSAFEQRYRRLYGEEPARLVTLAYDGTAMAAVLAREGRTSFDRGRLTNPDGFFGVDGLFRLKPTGEVERGLAVLEVRPGGPRVIDPAPEQFDPVGF